MLAREIISTAGNEREGNEGEKERRKSLLNGVFVKNERGPLSSLQDYNKRKTIANK